MNNLSVRNAVAMAREIGQGRPWVVCGKGPTFHVPPAKAAILSLNHVEAVLPRVDLAHFIDLEALEETKPHAPVVIPWEPNRKFRRCGSILPKLIEHSPSLLQAAKANRLGAYNRAGVYPGLKNPALPQLRAMFFSAEAAFHLLLAAGEKTIYSVGVDGGTQYAVEFAQKNRLANGRKTFNDQLGPIAELLKAYKAEWVQLKPGMDL